TPDTADHGTTNRTNQFRTTTPPSPTHNPAPRTAPINHQTPAPSNATPTASYSGDVRSVRIIIIASNKNGTKIPIPTVAPIRSLGRCRFTTTSPRSATVTINQSHHPSPVEIERIIRPIIEHSKHQIGRAHV